MENRWCEPPNYYILSGHCKPCTHYVLIDRSEAILVFLVAAHEIEFGSLVFTTPSQCVTEQDPSGRQVHISAVNPGVISPELILVIKVESGRGTLAIHFEKGQP